MPVVEQLNTLIEHKEPLEGSIPNNYKERTQFHELTIRFSTVPLSHRLNSLLTAVNKDIQPDNHITIKSIINASRQFELKQMRWQSIRLDGEEKGSINPTGWEHIYMDRGMDNVDIALRIALIGLQTQHDHREIINKILTGGIKSLNPDQLIETTKIISELLNQEKKDMTQTTRQFRTDTLQHINELPKDLTTSYYYKDKNDQIIAVATTMQRLPVHPSTRNPIHWQQVFESAQKAGIDDYNVQDLQRGRVIIDLLSHGMGSFNRGFVQLLTHPQQKSHL